MDLISGDWNLREKQLNRFEPLAVDFHSMILFIRGPKDVEKNRSIIDTSTSYSTKNRLTMPCHRALREMLLEFVSRANNSSSIVEISLSHLVSKTVV
jgi:hypothetical protein